METKWRGKSDKEKGLKEDEKVKERKCKFEMDLEKKKKIRKGLGKKKKKNKGLEKTKEKNITQNKNKKTHQNT